MTQAMGATQGESAKMSARMLTAAADLGSFHNADPTDMLDRLRAGLSGESEPLKKFGILLSEARVKQEAVRLGIAKAGDTLTDAQKLQARYSLILKDGAVAQGDFANTSDGLANKQRILKAQVTDLSAALGTALLPAAAKVMSVFAGLIGWMQQHTTITKVALGVVAALASGILVIVVATKLWAAAMLILNIVMAANPFVLVAALIAGLVVAFIIAYKNSETFRNIVNGVFNAVKATVQAFASFFTTTLPNAFRAVLSWVKSNWPLIAMIIAGPFAPLVALATNAFGIRSALTGAFSAILNAVRNTMSNIVGAVRGIVGSASSAASAVGNAIANAVRAGLASLGSFGSYLFGKISGGISSAAGAAGGAAYRIGSAIVSGILSGVGGLYGALKGKLESTLSSVLSSINPFSPVEHGGELYIGMPLVEGALKGIDGLGVALSRRLEAGIRSGVAGIGAPALGLGAVGGMNGGGGNGQVGPPIVIQITGNTMLTESYETAERLARLLQPALTRLAT